MTTTTAGYSGGLNIQKVQSKNAKKKKHQDDEEEEDGPTCIVVSKSKKNACRPLPPNVGLPRRYQIQSANKTVTVFECLLNFHYVEGDMVHHCADNFSWIGQEPLCEVDYYKSNMILSCSIGAFCTIATFLFLCGDMIKHMKKRTDTKFDRQKYKHTHFLYPRRMTAFQVSTMKARHMKEEHQRHDNDSYEEDAMLQTYATTRGTQRLQMESIAKQPQFQGATVLARIGAAMGHSSPKYV